MATATSVSIASDHSWRRNSIESILSIQGKETDVVRDTTDTETPWLSDDDLEYEPVTDSEPDEGLVAVDSSGESDKDIIKTRVIEVSVRDDGDLVFADSEPADSEETDSEMDFADYWKCAQCHARNNNPLYRYCEKCFKVRKNFFPPRPKRKFNYKPKTKKEPEFKYIKTLIDLSQNRDSGVDTAFTSQELSQSQNTELSSQTSEATSYSGVSEPSCSQHNLILNRSNLKRRAESADRTLKRAKIASDSDSDETDIEKDRRFRKSRSLDKDVAPLVKTVSDPSLTVDHVLLDDKGSETVGDNLCIVCLNEPKSGVFVHGRIAHICCCYKCAVKVWSKSKRCPVCNCKVSNVLRAVVM